jgi:dTMP kinase
VTRRNGLLIALEGIDGAGKSTLAQGLARRLRARGWRVARWHEPVDPELGRRAQQVAATDPVAAGIQFTLDRMIALPRLRRLRAHVDVVLSDRSFYSTLAYQGSALSPRAYRALAHLQSTATIRPDRVLWVDLAPAAAVRRVRGRGRGRAPLEKVRTLERVARRYRALARAGGWQRLDGRAGPDEVLAAAEAAVRRWLRGRRPRPAPRA